jgi:hypothetical protein
MPGTGGCGRHQRRGLGLAEGANLLQHHWAVRPDERQRPDARSVGLVCRDGLRLHGAQGLGVEYQHYDIGNKNAVCGDLRCNVGSAGPYDLSTTGDLVRARLTIKTQGYGFLYAGPAY